MPNEKKIEAKEILITGTDNKSYILVKPQGKYGWRSEWSYYKRTTNKNIVEGAIESWVNSGNERKFNDERIDVTGNHISPMAYAEHIRKYLQSNGLGWGTNDTYYVLNNLSIEGEGGLQIVGLKPVADGDNPSTLRKKRTMKTPAAPTVKKPTLAPQSTSSSMTLPPPPPSVSSSSSSNANFKFIAQPDKKGAQYVLDTKSNKVYTLDNYVSYMDHGETGGFKFNPIGYIVSKDNDEFPVPEFREKWPAGSIEKIIADNVDYTLNIEKEIKVIKYEYPKGLITLKKGYEVLNTDENMVLDKKPFKYNNKTYRRSKYPDNEGNYNIFTDEENPKYIGDIDSDMEIDTQQWEFGYDSEFDERKSDYPYEIITTYQVSPEKIDMRKKMQDANAKLTDQERNEQWVVNWNKDKKRPEYYNQYEVMVDEGIRVGADGEETEMEGDWPQYFLKNGWDDNGRDKKGLKIDETNMDSIRKTIKKQEERSKKLQELPSRLNKESQGLSRNWQAHASKTKYMPDDVTPRLYYHNRETGQKSWIKPTSGGKKNRKSKRKLNKKSKRKTKKN